LAANDKAGIAAIMTTLEILKENPDIPHGEIKIAFIPDQETGHGVNYFDMEKISADFAYTVDGVVVGVSNPQLITYVPNPGLAAKVVMQL